MGCIPATQLRLYSVLRSRMLPSMSTEYGTFLQADRQGVGNYRPIDGKPRPSLWFNGADAAFEAKQSHLLRDLEHDEARWLSSPGSKD